MSTPDKEIDVIQSRGGLIITGKQILWGILICATALMTVGIGVYAFFSDVETASTNTFTTGTLNLQVGSADPTSESITIASLVPGNTGNAANWAVTNAGSVNGDLTIGMGAITNNENVRSEVETAAGDSTDGATTGELGANLKIALWMDADKDGTWSTGDYYLVSDCSKQAYASGTTLPAAAYDVADNFSGDTWADVQTNKAPGNIGNFHVEYDLPAATTNVVQSDSCVFDLVFTLDQV